MPLTVTSKEREAGVITVCPAGSLDSNTYTILEERLAQAAQKGPDARRRA